MGNSSDFSGMLMTNSFLKATLMVTVRQESIMMFHFHYLLLGDDSTALCDRKPASSL